MPLPDGGEWRRFRPLRAYDLTIFTAEEVETLKAVAERWRDATRDEIVDASRQETPWLATSMHEQAPRHLALHRRLDMPVSECEREAEIESMLASFAMEGIDIPREVAELAFDRAYADLLPAPARR